MHTKLKHLVVGLALSTLAIAGGVLVGEPAPVPFARYHTLCEPATGLLAAEAQPEGAALLDQAARSDSPTLRQTLSPARHWNPEALRASFQMPFFSFGAILPRAPASSEN